VEALNILVVDSQPALALPVIDALRDLGHRTEVQNGGGGAISAVAAKRRANRPYHMLIANFEMADMDAVEFLHSLRQHRETVPVCFYAHTHSLPREAFSAVEHLDGRFVSLPIDRTRLETLVSDVMRGVRRATETGGESPFFGTGRVVRRSASSITDSVPAQRPAPPLEPMSTPRPESASYLPPPAPPLPPATQLPPVTTSVSRRSSEVPQQSPFPFPEAAPATDTVLRGTARFSPDAGYLRTPLPGTVADPEQPRPASLTERHRRSVTGQHQAPGTQPPVARPVQQPGTGSFGSTTSRIRRSITGKVANPAAQSVSSTGQARVARCRACAKDFYAELRAEAYSLPCLYCGELNRIDPA
jgi:CheY-like chemotaxis protein